jgi:hypothetical protein
MAVQREFMPAGCISCAPERLSVLFAPSGVEMVGVHYTQGVVHLRTRPPSPSFAGATEDKPRDSGGLKPGIRYFCICDAENNSPWCLTPPRLSYLDAYDAKDRVVREFFDPKTLIKTYQISL